MARSIATINSEILAAKEADTELQNINSTSATAIWRLWAWVTAAVIFSVESMFDLFKVELTTLLQSQKPGTLQWYQSMCREFQYGDDLVWVDGKYLYQVIDPAKQIIAQCSVSEGNSGLVVKIAKESGGELEQLLLDEEVAFKTYLSKRKYAGTKVSPVNSSANKLWIQATVIYDPLLLHADGTLIIGGLRPVDAAITTFLRNLPFSGILRRSAIMDAIQKVPGVIDCRISLLQSKYGLNAYQEIVINQIPESGYFKIDTAHPLNTNITYNV